MEKLKRIYIGNQTYPFKIDMNVLEAIQEEYGSITEWERGILGIRYRFDSDGNMILTKEGSPSITLGEPSIRDIKFILPLMIREGQEIEYEQTGNHYDPISDEKIYRECNISFKLLAQMIHEEYKRCFEVKKN
ncbi:MAG: hypothetical protein MJZ37_08075 [Bacilli bacterium]|nr:hypothetical protein [Bacilli bacterium]